MPELPEVETIARALKYGGRNEPPVVGLTIDDADVIWSRTLETPDIHEFKELIHGQVIRDVRRRAKFLAFTLDSNFLLIHLRMSGDIRVEPMRDSFGEVKPNLPHDRLIIRFQPVLYEPLRMAFTDARKFGRVWLVKQIDEVTGLLGPEPLSDDFTVDVFFQKLQGTNRQIKPLLLDQHFLAGLGNIYTDEALYKAQVHPLRNSSSLSRVEAETLYRAVREVLEEGIRRNGSSIDWVYRGGDFQNSFMVYHRTGETCFRCGSIIERIVVGQRGTHFCPTCQK